MTADEGKKLQQASIEKFYNDLKEERVVTCKDVAFNWIQSIGDNYDGKSTIGELRLLVDELIAYAILGRECIE